MWANLLAVALMLNSQELFDALVRQSLYVENVKLGQANRFRKVIRELSEEFTKLLPLIKYDTLDGITKAELTAFVNILRKSQQRIWNKYTQELIDMLRSFMAAQSKVSKAIMAQAFSLGDVTNQLRVEREVEDAQRSGLFIPLFGWAAIKAGNSDQLWSRVLNSPLPSSGASMKGFIDTLAVSSTTNVENAIRQAYVNASTVNELKRTVLGSTDGMKGILERVAATGDAVSNTVIQQVSQLVNAAVQSAFYERYEWVSILDSRTSSTCRTLDGKKFQYGKGPLPPAHPNCRSHIAPDIGSYDAVESFSDWIERQPQAFKRDLYQVAQTSKFRADKPLTVEEYADKIDAILNR